MEMKYCPKCKMTKDISDFALRSNRKYYRSYCRECERIQKRKWDKRNPNKVRELNYISAIRRRGISVEEYNRINTEQNGKCAICGKDGNGHAKGRNRLFIDHNHQTGKVRGLLCGRCNVGIGYFMDNPILLQNAIDYISSFQ